MTNQVKGEVTFESCGQSYVFKLGTNAQVMLEQKVKMPLSKFLKQDRIEELGISDLRLIFWAGLYRQHNLTEDQVGDIIDDIGPERVSEIFLEAFESAKVKGNGVDSEAHPTKAAKQPTGMTS